MHSDKNSPRSASANSGGNGTDRVSPQWTAKGKAAVVEGKPRRPYSKQCGSPERGVGCRSCPGIGGGRALFRTAAETLPMPAIWGREHGDSRARTVHLCNIAVSS